MGGGYSKAEKAEAQKYIIKIQEAIGDNDQLQKYKKIRKELAQEIIKKKNASRFIIDYIKGIIKSHQATGRNKYLALLLLKDLMKVNKKNIIDYNNKKLLSRLFILADSNLKGKVLQTYDKKVDLDYSKKFYYLLLECFENWGKKYSKILKYNDFYLKLVKKKKIPIAERYYNYPKDDDVFGGQVLGDLNQEEDYLELSKEVDLIKKLRGQVVDKIVENPTCNFSEKKQINTMMKFYKENIDSLNNNELKRKLDNDNNQKFNILKEDMNREFFYFDDFQREYNKAEGYDNTVKFYNNLKELNTNYFNNNINVENAKDRLKKEKMREEEKEIEEARKIEKEREREREAKLAKEEKENDNNLNFEMNFSDDQPSFIDNDERKQYGVNPEELNAYDYEYDNENLENSVNMLEKKKKKLEENINSLQRNQKENLTPRSHLRKKSNNEADGLEKVLKKKEDQIGDLELKINNIEKEFKQMKDPEDYNFDFKRNSPYKERQRKFNGERERSVLSKSNARNKSASIIKSRYENSGFRNNHGNGKRNKYENSGTKFVNKMFDDVEKLLNKNQRGYRNRGY